VNCGRQGAASILRECDCGGNGCWSSGAGRFLATIANCGRQGAASMPREWDCGGIDYLANGAEGGVFAVVANSRRCLHPCCGQMIAMVGLDCRISARAVWAKGKGN